MSNSGGVSYVPLPEVVSVQMGGLSGYALNDLEDAEPMHIGKVTSGASWLIQKFTTGSVMSYANLSNNATVTSYADAWSNRATLTYGAFETLTGV